MTIAELNNLLLQYAQVYKSKCAIMINGGSFVLMDDNGKEITRSLVIHKLTQFIQDRIDAKIQEYNDVTVSDLLHTFKDYISKQKIGSLSSITIFSDGSGRIIDDNGNCECVDFENISELFIELHKDAS